MSERPVRKKNRKKSIGILTNPSKTFKVVLEKQIPQFQYDELPEEYKHKKQSFLDFLGGNFQEINTIVNELSSLGNVSVVLFVDKNLFVPENSIISPYELIHPKTIKRSFDFDKWINEKDAMIISLHIEKLKGFFNLYSTKIVHMNKLCIISTGRSMINELSKRFQRRFIFVERKGVARFGAENRQKILELCKKRGEL